MTQEGLKCPSCKAPLEPGSKFCPSCGTKVAVDGPAPAPAPDIRTEGAHRADTGAMLYVDRLSILFEGCPGIVRFRVDTDQFGADARNLQFTFENQLTREKVPPIRPRGRKGAYQEFSVTFPDQKAGACVWYVTAEYEGGGSVRLFEGEIQLVVMRPGEARQVAVNIMTSITAGHATDVNLNQNAAQALEKILQSKEDPFEALRRLIRSDERVWVGVELFEREPDKPSSPPPASERPSCTEVDAARARIEATIRKRCLERIPDADGFAERKETLSDIFDKAELFFESRLWTDAAREFTKYAEQGEGLEKLDEERKTAKTKQEGAQRMQAKASEAHAQTYAETEWTAGIKRFADGNSAFARMDFAAAIAAFDESAATFSRSVRSAEEGRKRREREAVERERQRIAREAAERKAGTVKTLTLSGGAEMRFRWCPAGTFKMGSPESEMGRYSDERQHGVTLTQGFWLAETPVTQRQWESVMGNNPSCFKGADRPVEQVSWDDCQAFIEKVNAQLSRERLRLPTEAEWEYACRAGTTAKYGGTGNLDEMGWYDGNSDSQTHPVKQKKPNAWGLYDMHGNVWEWCADWYGDYPRGSITDPAPSSGSHRVRRGGGWGSGAQYCRSADRNLDYPSNFNYYYGFRLACSAGLRDTETE